MPKSDLKHSPQDVTKRVSIYIFKKMVLPLRHSPDSTFPIRMVPMSENLSTIGIMKGPPTFRFMAGRESMYGMNDSPLEKKNNKCLLSFQFTAVSYLLPEKLFYIKIEKLSQKPAKD